MVMQTDVLLLRYKLRKEKRNTMRVQLKKLMLSQETLRTMVQRTVHFNEFPMSTEPHCPGDDSHIPPLSHVPGLCKP